MAITADGQVPDRVPDIRIHPILPVARLPPGCRISLKRTGASVLMAGALLRVLVASRETRAHRAAVFRFGPLIA